MDDDILDFDEHECESPSILNLYLYSSDPKLSEVADKIFKEVGFKGHERLIKNHLKLLLLNFIRAKKRANHSFLRYSRTKGFWSNYSTRKRYVWDVDESDQENPKWVRFPIQGGLPNPWGISRKLNDIVDRLHEKGLLHSERGSHDKKKQSRIAPTKEFSKRYLKPFKLEDIRLHYHPQEFPLVRVHIKSDLGNGKIHHTLYEAKGKTAIPNQLKIMKEELKSYNSFLKTIPITLRDTPTENIPKIVFDLQKKVYRVFSDREITKGGRFYGGWWQHELKSNQRKFIEINGNPTVELDYASQHACMAYGLALGRSVSEVLGDVEPYSIPKGDSMGSYPRSFGKAVFTRALNVRDRGSLKRSLLKTFQEDLQGYSQKDQERARECLPFVEKEFDVVMAGFEKLHKELLGTKKYLFSKERSWGTFQFYDSQVCAYVLKTLTLRKTPCLSIHDSFIVERKNEDMLRTVMLEAYTKASFIPDLSKCIPLIKR